MVGEWLKNDSLVENFSNKKFKLFFQAVVAHLIVLVAEATVGSLFLMACYKRLKRQHSDLIPATASLTCVAPSVSQPIVVHVNGKLPTARTTSASSSPTKSSTPLKRGYSLEDLEIDEDEVVTNNAVSRRMSLDSKFNPLNLK